MDVITTLFVILLMFYTQICLNVMTFIPFFQSYLWEDNEYVSRWLENDLRKKEGSIIQGHAKWLKREVTLKDIKE